MIAESLRGKSSAGKRNAAGNGAGSRHRAARRTSAAPAAAMPRPLQHAVAFKAAIYERGWSLTALAERWGMTRDGLLKIARDENRSLHFDDAVRGLKRNGPPIALRATWKALLAGAPPPPKTIRPGLRYRGYLVVGAVVAAIKHVGSIAEEGMHGIVVRVCADRFHEKYRVLFETGHLETFTPDQVDEYLQDVGLVREELQHYAYTDDDTVMRDFENGLFDFW
jgi:hypothetical protein